MLGAGVNVSVPIQSSEADHLNAGNGASWGGFGGGDWTINQKGSGVAPKWIAVGLGVVLVGLWLIKRGHK